MEIVLLRTKDDVHRMIPAIHTLAAELPAGDITYLPDYFLARIGDSRQPRVAVCYEQQVLVGVVYTEELRMLNMDTGWIFGGDEMGRGLVLSAPEREAEILAAACESFLQAGVHALRLVWRSTGVGADPLPGLRRSGLQVWSRSEAREQGDWLRLATDYETFLLRLGRHTRRNMRAHRRKAEAEGFLFVPDLPLATYEQAVEDLNQIARFPSMRERELRDRRFFARFGSMVLAGLAAPDGRLVSVLSGVRSRQTLHVLTQLNDEGDGHLSISLVLRGYLIEYLIAQGITSIHFVNGTSPMLGRFCDPVMMRLIAIDSRRSALHPCKLTMAGIARRWQERGHWVPMRLRALLGSYVADLPS